MSMAHKSFLYNYADFLNITMLCVNWPSISSNWLILLRPSLWFYWGRVIFSSFGSNGLDCYIVNRWGIVFVPFLISCMIFLAFTVCSNWFLSLAKPDIFFLIFPSVLEICSVFFYYFLEAVLFFYESLFYSDFFLISDLNII